MFRHHKETTTDEGLKKTESTVANSDLPTSANKVSAPEAAKAEPSLKELIEKNLKWSQIIYEQNRKINNKLLWSAVANWLRLLVIVVPIILAFIFLPPLLKKAWSQYGDLLGNAPATGAKQNSFENVLKLFNLDPAQQEQLKTLLK